MEPLTRVGEVPRLETGIAGLDELLDGGLPVGSMTALMGRPGTGKTVLAQQICFQHGTPEAPALYFSTHSEPSAKMLRYLRCFSFFDAAKLGDSVRFVDFGGVAGTGDLDLVVEHTLDHVKRIKPALVVMDSFRVLDELTASREDLRRFGYELAVRLMVWECTSLLLGSYARSDLKANPLFSLVDGVVMLGERRVAGRRRRLLEILKLRGSDHSCRTHPFVITENGVAVLRRERRGETVDPDSGIRAWSEDLR